MDRKISVNAAIETLKNGGWLYKNNNLTYSLYHKVENEKYVCGCYIPYPSGEYITTEQFLKVKESLVLVKEYLPQGREFLKVNA